MGYSKDNDESPPREQIKTDAIPNDGSVQAILARAICHKDPTQVKKVISQVDLTRNYAGASWSERLVNNFDPAVAQLLDRAGMPMRKVRKMLSKAVILDDPQAYEWILDHPKCAKFFSGIPQRSVGKSIFLNHTPWSRDYKWLRSPSEYDLALSYPFTHAPTRAKKVKFAIMSRPDYSPYAQAFSGALYLLVAKLVNSGDWQGVEFVFNNTSAHLGPDEAVKQMRQHFFDLARLDPKSGVFGARKLLPHSMSSQLFDDSACFELSVPFSAKMWFERTGMPDPSLQAQTLEQASLLLGTEAVLDLLAEDDLLDFYKKEVSDPKQGSAVLAMLAAHRPANEVGQVLNMLGDTLDGWRDSQGYNPAHIMMATRRTAALAHEIFQIRPHWLTEKVHDLPIPLEMIGHGSVNTTKLATQARVRRDILGSKVKAAKSAASRVNKRVVM